MSQPAGFSFGSSASSSTSESAQQSGGFVFRGASQSGSSFSWGGSSPPVDGGGFDWSGPSGSSFGFGSRDRTTASTPGSDQSRRVMQSINYDDDMDKFHAALAIEHNCDVSDIYRVLIRTMPANNRQVDYFTIFRMIRMDKSDRELCRVRTIIPAEIIARITAAGVSVRKSTDGGSGFIAAVREQCSTVYGGIFAPRITDMQRDIRKRHAEWARVHYRVMKRELTVMQNRLVNGQSGGVVGAPVPGQENGMFPVMIIMLSLLFMHTVSWLYGAVI